MEININNICSFNKENIPNNQESFNKININVLSSELKNQISYETVNVVKTANIKNNQKFDKNVKVNDDNDLNSYYDKNNYFFEKVIYSNYFKSKYNIENVKVEKFINRDNIYSDYKESLIPIKFDTNGDNRRYTIDLSHIIYYYMIKRNVKNVQRIQEYIKKMLLNLNFYEQKINKFLNKIERKNENLFTKINFMFVLSETSEFYYRYPLIMYSINSIKKYKDEAINFILSKILYSPYNNRFYVSLNDIEFKLENENLSGLELQGFRFIGNFDNFLSDNLKLKDNSNINISSEKIIIKKCLSLNLKFIINEHCYNNIKYHDFISIVLFNLGYFNIYNDIKKSIVIMNCYIINLDEASNLILNNEYFSQLFYGYNQIIPKPFIYKHLKIGNLSPIRIKPYKITDKNEINENGKFYHYFDNFSNDNSLLSLNSVFNTKYNDNDEEEKILRFS